ncbi:MAG: beta-ketoacyl-ACP synthase II [Thermodesulfobacteriota bacterium]|nr:beta-ketoacyl-ACP synthase II [Thermodesulfobacteriota bacterium]
MKRIVITGMGAITPLGIGVDVSWKALCAGKSGIDYITRFDVNALPTKIAGEVKNFNPEDYLDKKQIKRMDLFTQYALVSTIMAVEDANISFADGESERVGVIMGIGLGGIETFEKNHALLLNGGYKKVSPFFIPMLIANMASSYISIHYGIKGPTKAVITACASSAHAIGDAFKMLQCGLVDVAICGGSEAAITPLGISGFSVIKALSTRNDDPPKASRPFDKERDGFVPAEGAGVLILEELEHALSRGAKIYAELVGYGANSDAYHITAPEPSGQLASRCMEMAILDAGININEVDYINAHGTSTPLNDAVESKAIHLLFKEHARALKISSIKSMIGHLLGAAGAVEAISTILTIKEGIIPPTLNYENPDPDCDLDYVPNVALKKKVSIGMSSSFGFGGHNASLVFREF